MSVTSNERLDFGDDPDHDADPRIFKGIFNHCGIICTNLYDDSRSCQVKRF